MIPLQLLHLRHHFPLGFFGLTFLFLRNSRQAAGSPVLSPPFQVRTLYLDSCINLN